MSAVLTNTLNLFSVFCVQFEVIHFEFEVIIIITVNIIIVAIITIVTIQQFV